MRFVTRCMFVAAATSLAVGAQTAKAVTSSGAGDPSLSSNVALPNTSVVLLATKGQSEASVQLAKGFYIGGPDFQLFAAARTTVALTGSQNTVTVATQEGLGDAGTLRLSLSPVYWATKAIPNGPDPNKLREICRNYLGKDECTRAQLPAGDAREELDSVVQDYGTPVFGSIAIEIGRQSYAYRQSDTLVPETARRTPFALTGSLGVFLTTFGYLGGFYERRAAFAEGQQTTLCEPYAEITGVTTCDSAVLGAPTRQTTNRFGGEARWFGNWLSVNAIVRYDTDREAATFQVPFYFIANAGGALIGGIKPSYDTGTRDLTFSVFVGGALSKAPGF